MSDADDLRAAKESRAEVAQRAATRRGLGNAMTRLVNAAVYRATHRPGSAKQPAATEDSTVDTEPSEPE